MPPHRNPRPHLHLYGWGHQSAEARIRGENENSVHTAIGAKILGRRFETITIDPVARQRITEARRILEWAAHLTTRFDTPPQELLDLIGLDRQPKAAPTD